ncbi:MAG TPA: hypothetical protein VFZ22_15475 [Pyrinomonadaceae bacterium]|nr:hypothetical protein [Pyrinomonadaceae bacterium]
MRWKSRLIAFVACFIVGFLLAAIVAGLLRRFSHKQSEQSVSPCATGDYFNQPEEVLSALKSPEVDVRRAMFTRLLLRPDIRTIYYDYERDLNYPERADRARLQYVQLDDSPGEEALLTFVRFEHPVALVFKKQSCGWRLVAAVGSWLRFEDYPYENWLSLVETIEPGIHQLLVRESHSDATSYVRKARVLRLTGDVLKQVAEIEEEAIEPVSGYSGADWSDVKRHRVNRCIFSYVREGDGANIVCNLTEETLELKGPAPHYSYWLETDGSWHARQSNWHRRAAQRAMVIDGPQEVLVWNSQEGRFVK